MGAPKWNLIRLHEFSKDEDKLFQYLVDRNLLPKEKICPKCGSEMKLSGQRFRCYTTSSVRNQKKKQCNGELSINSGTWFQRSKLSHAQVLKLTYMIIRNYHENDISREIDVNKNTVTDWVSFARQIMEDWSMHKSEKIGGPGIIVEIDESKFGKRKYHRGHPVEGQWVFGGLERGSGKIFMVPVEDRTRETLLLIIKEWIIPGTIIMSDFWKAYDTLGDEGYVHLKVNHSVEFVSSENGAHTNGIESSWRHAKQFLPHYSRKKKQFPGYLAHYMFVKKCKMDNLDELEEFFSEVSQVVFSD